MKTSLIILLSILIFSSCKNKTPIEFQEIYFGNNDYHLPCIIVNVDRKINTEEIIKIQDSIYFSYPHLKKVIRSLIKYKDQSYALAFSKKDGKIKDYVYYFDSIYHKYNSKIDSLNIIKQNSILKNDKIYGIYLSTGDCIFIDLEPITDLYIITKDDTGQYALSLYNLNNYKITKINSLTSDGNTFTLETSYWYGFNSPSVKSKNIYYETADKHLAVKELHYVNENEDKYGSFLIRLK